MNYSNEFIAGRAICEIGNAMEKLLDMPVDVLHDAQWGTVRVYDVMCEVQIMADEIRNRLERHLAKRFVEVV